MSARDWVKLAASIVVCQAAGGIGALATDPDSAWYRSLDKPAFTPPDWVFGPVWITLYFVMAVAAFLVWRIGLNRPAVRFALGVFALQLLVNAAWSLVFFDAHRLAMSLLVIIVLWVLIVTTMILFFRLHRVAGVLLVPYLLWVSYATAINFAIVRLN